MRLLILFIAIPIIEIGLFIEVGGWIGLWPTLALVILTAIIGVHLLKQQGRNALFNLQNSFQMGKNPAKPLADGAMILVAGVLLLTPGFFTDAVGFCLLTPFIRDIIIKIIKPYIVFNTMGSANGSNHQSHHPHANKTKISELDEFEEKRKMADDAETH